MDRTKVSNRNGEMVLFSRLVEWSHNNREEVVLVADDGTSVKVNRVVFEYLSYLADGERFDVVFTPLASNILKTIGRILNLENENIGKSFALVQETVECIGISVNSIENIITCISKDNFHGLNDKENDNLKSGFDIGEFEFKMDMGDASDSSEDELNEIHEIKIEEDELEDCNRVKVEYEEDVVSKQKKSGRKRFFPDILECDTCGKGFKGKEKVGRKMYHIHTKKCQMKSFDCGCPETFSTFKDKQRHVRIEHMGYVGCTLCHMSFKDEKSLNNHMTFHGQVFVCEECGYTANKRHIITNHKIKKHTTANQIIEEIPKEDLTCNECKKICADMKSLKQHIRRVHNPLPCTLCGKIVKNMKFHMNNTHTDDSEKRFRCESCGKGFIDNSNLKSHMINVHIKSRPYRCRYAGCENIPGYNDVSNRNSHEKQKHGDLYEKNKSLIGC